MTGASAGIGEAICHALATSGMKVVGVARRVDRIEVSAGIGAAVSYVLARSGMQVVNLTTH